MKKIKKVKIFYNNNKQSEEVYKKLKNKLIKKNFEIVEDEAQVGIAIGGDGSFIRMLKATNYNQNMLYIGINAGTLGFLQEVKIGQLDALIESLESTNYEIAETGIQENHIEMIDRTEKYYSFNEIVVRRKDLSLSKLDIIIDNIKTERFIGDALLIATSVGSTAHSMSYGGAVVHESLHAMQLVPIGVFNNVINQTLKNTLIVPDNKHIEIIPLEKSRDLLITIDGENYTFNKVNKITTRVCTKKIKRIRLKGCNFFKKLNSKFININNN